ncbi:unnamed protein product [Trichobilharzia regenti]|uniref:SHSP domain-containing protein n=1 Tax=Trichobilharzia regenti TaxID=157069 RepID=A0A183VJD1_TRIRE|nr:unnamed protein product [Trichobilharzia regenti]VDP95367.1 unnamed protein product [Trichobilharzia regenti]
MTNYRTELRIPVERNKKSVIHDNYLKNFSNFDNDTAFPLDDKWRYNNHSNNTNKFDWDSRHRHTSGSNDQFCHQIPWHKRFRTISASPMRFTETTDYLYDDMKRRMEERRRRWNEEFRLMHNDILSPSRLSSSNDLFSSRDVINSPSSSRDTLTTTAATKTSGYEQFQDGSVHFVANFNLSDYDPELVKVFVRDGQLVVTAKTERSHSAHSLNTMNNHNNNNNNNGSTSSLREYSRSINLPPGVDDEKISALLSLNGILTVSCPMKPPPFSSSVDGQSSVTNSEVSSDRFWNNNNNNHSNSNNNNSPHYQYHSPRKLSQQLLNTFELKSPKLNHSTRSVHSDYDINLHSHDRDHQHPFNDTRSYANNNDLHRQAYRSPRKRRFCLELPIDSEYSPSEIQIKTLNRRIYVKARHEERGLNRTAVREFSKEYDIPDHVDPESLTAKFSNGILYIEEPII